MTPAKRFACLALTLAVFSRPGLAAEPATPSDAVNVFVGTGGHGHTFPGATVPFGFVQLSPDTPKQGWDGAAGYHYSESSILGFSHTHLSGTGVGDLGDLLILPTTGDLQSGENYQPLDAARLASPFSHENEAASPGYYRVALDRYHVTAELTATAHTGLHRYTFPADQAGHVVLDLVHGIGNHTTAATLKAETDHRITGSRATRGWSSPRAVYFVIETSRPFKKAAFEKDDKSAAGQAVEAKVDDPRATAKVRAALDFEASAAPLVVRVGLSAVSVEQAQKNLDAEVKGFDFDAARDAARKQWNDHLSRLAIETPEPAVRRTFYTALYHTMLAPTLYNDADGTYRGHDGKVHTGEGFANYSTFSLWDTFRAEHPLLTLVAPDRVNDFVQSGLSFYQQSKQKTLPIWSLASAETHCMIGYHAAPMIYDAYAKGFRGFDADLALKAMQDTAHGGEHCPDDYAQRGYVVSDPGRGTQGVARTLEYSYDDWCIARLATALGKADVAKEFDARSLYFGNLFDSKTGFFRGRTEAGGWREPFDLRAINFDDYTEANAWQYGFFVPQDVPAMIKMHGGREAFLSKLDACFDQDTDMPTHLVDVTGLIGQYSHGNEPCHHMPYLYALAGAQDKTAKRVRQIMRTQYDDSPEGLCGNDDCGQMSAWYAWSAIGLYPLNPADGRYVIGSPLVKSATLRLDPKYAKGTTFTVQARNASGQNQYVQSARLNGQPLDRPWVTHEEITRGGTLELDMGMFPNRTWNDTLPPDRPTNFRIEVDASKAPDLQGLADRIQPIADRWYAREIELMRPNDPTVPTLVKIVIDPAYDGVAAAMNNQIVMSAKYFRTHPDDLGAVVHELAHVVQGYPGGAPGWFTEGFADYVRWFLYEPPAKRPRPNPEKATYKDSYQTSAAFLNWVARERGAAVLYQMNADCHAGEYKQENWKTYTGKSLEQLGDDWKKSLRPNRR